MGGTAMVLRSKTLAGAGLHRQFKIGDADLHCLDPGLFGFGGCVEDCDSKPRLGESMASCIRIASDTSGGHRTVDVTYAYSTICDIRKDKIQYVHGQNAFQINANQINAIQLTVFSDTRIRLKILYAHHRKSRVLRFGVRPQIVLSSLSDSLPLLPKIVDARNRTRRDE